MPETDGGFPAGSVKEMQEGKAIPLEQFKRELGL